MAPSKHTILLMQPYSNIGSRTYYDFNTATEASNQVIALFERELKRLNPTIQRIQYSIQDVFNYIDSLPEIAFLVNDNYNGYTLIPKEGIKKRVHEVFIQESTRQ